MTKRTIPVLVASYCPVPVKKIFYTAPVILLLLFPVLCSVAQTISSNAVPVVTAVTNGSFESNTVTDPAGYSYTPNIVATGWTLGNTHAGLTKNNTAFTAGNPGTTAGVQVLFLQIAGSAETTINMPAAGYYRFSMRAAKRGNGGGNQTIAVSMNGTVFDTIKPASIQYNLYRTGVVFMNAGNNVLKLQGLSVGVDNTAFIDDVKYERIASWSATASWTGGVVPSAASQVVIDAGEAVVLDVNTTVKNLHIQGELIAARDKDLQLGSDWIMVNGPGAILNWGTPTTPYKRKAVITLRGVFTNDTANVNNWKAGENFLAARNYGTIEMHGESKMSWTQLEATALKNQGTITVKDITNWSVADSIVIASTDFNPTQAEVKAITAISGKTITLHSPLAYMHYGVTHTYNGLVLDERAEVGLLTRNIRIQSNNPVNGFGGHCMFLNNGKARFSGVEFLNLGQKARKGRYPLHWHELGSMNGQYVQFSSIHNSFNRAVAIHDTDSGRIENNVAYNHIGHGFYLEDNLSTRNYFYRNLGILTRLPAAGEAIEPHDRTPNATLGSTLFTTPVTFWINHPDNDFIENVAAGSDGSGFWYLGQNNQKMGLNINNRGHSNTFNFTVDGNINAAGVFTYGHFRPPAGQT
ncbi:MAG: hypothetical protein JNM68_11920, partial [Dinghuibacter sp.]|nr:hypothetical protein [Dinghuibacter sp.]